MMWLVFAVFLGVISGYAVSIIAPEELKSGQRFFKILYAVLFSAAVFSFVVVYNFPAAVIISLIVLALASFRHVRYSYLAAGLLLNNIHIVYTASLIFIMGIPLVSIDAQEFLKNDKILKLDLFKKVLIRYVWFIPIGLLPFLFS